MLRTLFVTAASSAVLLAATSAGAQEAGRLGTKGQLIFSADRLVPLFAYNSFKVTDQNNSSNSVTESGSAFSLLPNVNGFNVGGQGGRAANFYNIPRLGIDYTVIDNLTIGGSVLFYFTAGGSTEVKRGGASGSQDAPSGTLFGIAPRIGYTLHLSDLFTFWPRGGFGFYTASSKQVLGPVETRTDSINQFAINLEPIFALTPVPNFFFFFGPVIDIPLTGSIKEEHVEGNVTTTVTQDSAMFHFGVTAGLGGYINL